MKKNTSHSINTVFRTLGLQSKKDREKFLSLGQIPLECGNKKVDEPVPTLTRNNTVLEAIDAELEPAS